MGILCHIMVRKIGCVKLIGLIIRFVRTMLCRNRLFHNLGIAQKPEKWYFFVFPTFTRHSDLVDHTWRVPCES